MSVEPEQKPLEGSVVDKLLEILPRKLGLTPEDLLQYPDTRILQDNEDPDAETLGATSLQALRGMNAVEEEFGFLVPEDELSRFRTFRSSVEYVEAKIVSRESGGA